MDQQAFDPREYLDHLRAEGRVLRWAPLDPSDPVEHRNREWDRTKDALDYLHQHWALPDQFDVNDAGGGPKGRLLAVVGRLVHRVLGRYLREERELLSHLVQLNAALDRRCEQLAQRCDEITRMFADRQVAEASNLAALAAWLHAEPPVDLGDPGGVTGSARDASERSPRP